MAGERSCSDSAADSDSAAAPKRALARRPSMFPGVDTTKPALEESQAKAPMVVAPMRAAGETVDIDALLPDHVALRVQADIAAATRGGWGVSSTAPLAPAPPAPAPVPATASPIVSPLWGACRPIRWRWLMPCQMLLLSYHQLSPEAGLVCTPLVIVGIQQLRACVCVCMCGRGLAA
eukprot:359614-Chlamydomonas_euryale.AAC.3